MQQLHKPDVTEVYEFLRSRNAFIVHFSGTPKGSGGGKWFPNDLRHVIEGRAMGGLSSSLVRPGDNFRGFKRNATGSIGVILGLQSKASLVAVDPSDCGSIEDEQGNRTVQNERDITMEDLARTLDARAVGDYNEWIIRNYDLLGIFAVPPSEVSVLKIPTYSEDVPEYLAARHRLPADYGSTVW